jgi:outer membrane protein assembly factor BamB
MTTRPDRPTRSGAALALAIAAVLLAEPATAQQLPSHEPPARVLPTPIDFATSQDDNLFSLVRSQDDIHNWELALRELEQGEHRAAVQRLHELLASASPGVVPVAPGRFLGLRHAVVLTLANVSPAAAAAYETLVQREAGNLLARDLVDLGTPQLEQIADRFPTARVGRRARLRLADLALQRGDGLAAAAHYRLALDASAIGSGDERRAAGGMATAALLSEPARSEARVEQLPSDAAEVLRALGDDVRSGGSAAIGGGRSGARPMPEPVGNPIVHWREEVVAPGFDLREKGELAMFPVGDLAAVFVNTGLEVLALDPLRRRLEWISHSPLRDAAEAAWSIRDYGPTLNQDMVLSPALGRDVVVAALQVPDTSVNVDFQASLRIMSKIPQRRLFAFHRQSGKKLWAHFDRIDGPFTRRYRGQDSCAPPLVADDVVYAPVHDRAGAIAFGVAAYDARTGEPTWRRLVCSSQQDVNMFGNARMEFAASPLALADGVLYGAANLGVCYAIEASTGRLRWIVAYDVVHMPEAMMHGQPDRPVYFANNAPVVVDGVVCFTPLDSQFALGIDTETGQVLWRLPYDARIGGEENRVSWLCGAIGDEFVFSGAGTIAVQARPKDAPAGRAVARQLLPPDRLGDRRRLRLAARPAVTAQHVFVPTRDRILAVDVAGNTHPSLPVVPIDGYQGGNLLLLDGAICSLRQRNFEVLLDARAMLAQSHASTDRDQEDPAAILRLATLTRALAGDDAAGLDGEAALALYRRGLAACLKKGLPTGHPVRVAIQQELFEHARKAAFAAGDARALERLVEARDLAPDLDQWIEVQRRVLEACRSDRTRLLTELAELERRAPGATLPGGLTVAAFGAWQRAMAHEHDPAQAVQLWQLVLERHGQAPLPEGTAAAVAEAAIARLMLEHGATIYAEIERRAEAARANAVDDAALSALTSTFPNSRAAAKARLQLLDRAVARGDLGVAVQMMGRALAAGDVPPGMLRRVQVAARQRGNFALAAAMAAHLLPHADTPSDYEPDQGTTYGRLPVPESAASPAQPGLTVPLTQVRLLPLRAQREYVRLVPVITSNGFSTPPAQVPLYAQAGADLVAYDTTTAGPPLFARPTEFLEHLLLCGPVLVVPDTHTVTGIDHRTGELLWQHGANRTAQFEGLGVTRGLLHVVESPGTREGYSSLLAIEPLTGAIAWSRPLADDEMKPKATAHDLLLLTARGEQSAVLRIDAATGAVRHRVPLAAGAAHGTNRFTSDSLATRLYPPNMSADDERLYVPLDSLRPGSTPQVLAFDHRGALVWRFEGGSGTSLLMAQRHADQFVVCEASEQRPARLVVLDARTGQPRREAELGAEAAVLNWERSSLDNPAPPILVIDALVARRSQQRQVVFVGVADERAGFAVPLGAEDGDTERTPQFGPTFVTFVTRPRDRQGVVRIYAIDLETRAGAFPNGQKYRMLGQATAPHGMGAIGPYTVLATSLGLLLLDDGQRTR